jgi:hypothetical protein
MRLLARFWDDDTGSIIASEYLVLGTVVSVSTGIAGNAISGAVNEQAQQFAAATVALNHSYVVPAQSCSAGSYKAGTVHFSQPVNVCP